MLHFQPYHSPIFISSTVFISLLCILKHSTNIVRLKNGTESKVGAKKSPAPENEASLT